jgi:hypothetical protein
MTEQQVDYAAMLDAAIEAADAEGMLRARDAAEQLWRAEVREWQWDFGPNDADHTSTSLEALADSGDASWTVGRLRFQVAGGQATVTTEDGGEVWTS